MDYHSLILVFTAIIYEALPFIVLGVIIAGLLEEFVPQQAIAKVIPSNRFLAIGLGGLLGLVFPMCECGIIVVMKRLLRKGLPLSVCVCYMLAGPIINVVVMLSTYVAFTNNSIYDGPVAVVLLRVGLGYIVAVVTGIVVEWQFSKHGLAMLHRSVSKGIKDAEAADNIAEGPRTWWQRLNNITQTALHDFVDIMAFLVLGAALAAGGRALVEGNKDSETERCPHCGAEVPIKRAGGVQPDQVVCPSCGTRFSVQQNPFTAIPLMMGIAILFCLCSEADAFVAANFTTVWPAASKLAFLVLGPMLDLKLYLMYTRVFRPRLIFTIILTVVVQVFVYCLIVHYVDQALRSSQADRPVPSKQAGTKP